MCNVHRFYFIMDFNTGKGHLIVAFKYFRQYFSALNIFDIRAILICSIISTMCIHSFDLSDLLQQGELSKYATIEIKKSCSFISTINLH